MRAYNFSDPVPDSITNLKIWRLASRIGHSRCFYSGINCLFYDEPISSVHLFPCAATREHLIPRGRCGLLDQKAQINVVISSAFMNNLLGDAPLMVKLEVKKMLLEQSPSDLKEMGANVRDILDSYRVDNKFPWQLSSFIDHEQYDEMKSLMKIVQEQEARIFSLIYDLHNPPVIPLNENS